MEAADVERLRELKKNDATVSQYFTFYDQGKMNFETMLLRLAVQLSGEKATVKQKLRDVVKDKTKPTLFGLEKK